ncbi:MAG: T9SS type A sorting domain-containing protein [Bacteroidia bacterium]|nr:T9SS type A sorting domain-containing protein [Bacteroidia bacterium]
MRILLVFLSFLLLSSTLPAQQRIKMMHYNLLNFGNNCGNVDVLSKYAWLETILEEARPDVFTVNEINPNPIFSNGIVSRSFGYTNAIKRASITNQANSSIVNQLFYNEDKLELISESVIPYSLRDINAYRLFVKGSGINGNDSLFFYCIVGHFKATDESSSANSRAVAANLVMNWIDQNANGDGVVVMGDFNIYRPSETAYQTMTNNSNAALSLVDVISTVGWGGAGGAAFYTQSTRTTSQDCGSAGGMDDRFDMMLFSSELVNANSDLQLENASYTAFGNDSNPYNQSLQCQGNSEVPFSVCTALILMSDHLPVIADLVASTVVSTDRDLRIPGLRMNLAPNPVADNLTIDFLYTQIQQEDFNLSLQNMLGQKVWQRDISSQTQRLELPMSQLESGLYILKIEDSSGRFLSEKVLKR